MQRNCIVLFCDVLKNENMLFLHILIFQLYWMSEAHQNESWKLGNCILGKHFGAAMNLIIKV